MKGHQNRKMSWINLVADVIVTAAILVGFLFSVLRFYQIDFSENDNRARILVAQQQHEIEKGIYEKGTYPYVVIDLAGNILYVDEMFQLKPDQIVNVDEMIQRDKSFYYQYKGYVKKVFTLQNQKKVDRFVVYLLPQESVLQMDRKEIVYDCFFPIMFGAIIGLGIVFLKSIYFNRRILKPLREICNSSKGIMRGNYDLEVVRTYGKKVGENEVSELTYSFELMRDELKEKQIREEELKKSQQELISCISHDLKTPISTIKAYSEGIRDQIPRNKEEEKQYVDIIIRKTNLLTSMIADLLTYSNAQLNQLDINMEELYFSHYFEEVMEELKSYIIQKGIDFTYENKAMDMILLIDAKRITEVFYNLVENSIKYGATENRKLTISASREKSEILIVVKDNGIGMSADDIPYVFDKFFRAEKSRSSSIPGSGLGLSICKYIIEKHNGEIFCKSKKGEGCEIGFTLPVK